MNIIFIALFLTNSFSFFLCLNNPDNLPSDYPFSVKKDSNTAVIFSSDYITLFDVTKTDIPIDPLDPHNLLSQCPSGEEKGGIFYSNHYFTTCLYSSSENNKFQIKVFDSSFTSINIYPSDDTYFTFTSPIRFFIKTTSPQLVEATWLNGGIFNLAKFDQNNFGIHLNYPVGNMARDTDCVYISNFRKIICAFGILENEINQCAVNIFTDENSLISNLKIFQVCTNHQSRKLKLDNTDKNTFYYYFVDMEFNAYILPLTMTSESIIENGNVVKIMSGCDDSQNSFDLAEDKFNGYFVFTCIEKRFKQKIKIQLFRLVNNIITFYEDKNVDNTFEFEDEVNSEFSKVNFVVLKTSLNFGFLSYRTISSGGRYTIFNQPGCSNFFTFMNDQNLYQNKEIELDFTVVIKNDNYEGGKIQIVEQGEGMDVSVLSSGVDIKFTSKDYVIGELSFTFLVKNTFYKSDICIAYIEVKDCFSHCETCSYKSENFFAQGCERGCKPGSYPMINFPKDHNDNCCEKDVDCPNYLYYNYNKYQICHISCLACTSSSEFSCTTCYNEKELEEYSLEEQGYISEIKQETSSLYYYWEDDEHRKCVNKDDEPYFYLDEESLTYKPCYYSCEFCFGHGDSTNNNCRRCKENEFYYHLEDIYSLNCLNREEAPKNYYLFQDNYVSTETEQSRYWTSCNYKCGTCDGGNKEDCTSCSHGYYPKCEEKELEHYECFNLKPEINYYFNEELQCYGLCDPICETCDKAGESNLGNCLTCNGGRILFNRHCYIHCPQTHFELDHKMCVDKCPEYTVVEYTKININEFYYQCYNCKDLDKCIYLGSQNVPQNLINQCIECDSITKTFISNVDYNILDDCFELCSTCIEKGSLTQMNCLSCYHSDHCLVEGVNNCVVKNDPVDYYYMNIEIDGTCTYKKCYYTCKSCNGEGNSENNNCIHCSEGYQPDPKNSGNCVKVCEYYWYIDPTTDKYTCTESSSCPRQMPYLAILTKECVSDCIYAYNSVTTALYKYQKTCVAQCPDNTMKDNLLFACYSLDDSKEIFSHIQNYISYQSLPPPNLLIYSNDKTKYFHLYNTTQKSLSVYKDSAINVGTSLIDVSTCITTLRKEYGYDNNEIFYIGIMDIIREDTSAPQFEYTIHDHNGIKLNIELCKDDIIVINKSFVHSENMFLPKYIRDYYNYDIINYDKNNKFFCDICSLFQYDKNDPFDVILNDRYNSFYKSKNYFFCEEICDSSMTKLYLDDSRVECVCKGKKSYTSLEKENFAQFNKIEQKCHDWFLQYLKCGNNFFNKNIFNKNYVNVLMFLFILMQILSIFLFFFISKKKLRNHFNIVLNKKQKLRKEYLKENPIQENFETHNSLYNNTNSNREYSKTASKNKNNTYTHSQENSEQYSKNTSQSYSKSQNSKNNTNNEQSSKVTNSNNYSNKSSSYVLNKSGSNNNSNTQSNITKSDDITESPQNSNKESNQSKSKSKGTKSKDKTNSENDIEENGEISDNKNSKKSESKEKDSNINNEDNEDENEDYEDSEGNSNSKSNPPKKPKKKIEKSSSYNDDNDISVEDIDESERNKDKNKNKKKKNEEEEKNDKIKNKKAPKTAFQKYSKRFLKNRKDYVDDSYREDSFDFKLEKNWRKRGSEDDYEDYEEEEEEEDDEYEEEENNTQGTKSKSIKEENSKTNSDNKNVNTGEKKTESKLNSNKNNNSNNNQDSKKSDIHNNLNIKTNSKKSSKKESNYNNEQIISSKATDKSQILSINKPEEKRKSKLKRKRMINNQFQSIQGSEPPIDEKRENQLYPQLITEKRTFSDAIEKFEKKSFCYLYWYILKKRHRVIALFIRRDKYDFFSIKFSYLILSLTIDFFFITFFFLDYVIRYSYKKNKHIEPLCTIILGIGCPSVTHAVMRGFDILMDNIKKKFKEYEAKDENVQKNYVYTLNMLIKDYTKEIIIYYLMIFLFSLFVWYMVGTFIGSFYYIQKMWLVIFGVSFLLSNFFPLIFYLIAVKLQYEGIHQKDIKLFRKGMTMQKI